MPRFCAVFGCANKSNRERDRKYFGFPGVRDRRGRDLPEGVKRRECWIKAINRADLTAEKIKNASVCSDHFLTGWPAPSDDSSNPDYAPSQKLGYVSSRTKSRTMKVEATRRDYRSKKILLEGDIELENDMENYVRWKLTGGLKIMKKTAIPHKFECLNDRKKGIKTLRKRQTFSSEESNEPKPSSSSEAPASEAIFTIAKQQHISKLAVDRSTQIEWINPRRDIGLKTECMFIIDLIKNYTHLDINSILLTLQKIRLAQTFFELGHAYGMSEIAASRTFIKSVSLISELMREFIIWPPKEKIKILLPLLFKIYYSEVQCIIDCFEIEIEKPTDAVQQALTWSDYKKINTLKYLVSSTPDGVVSFISTAFGGKTSDAVILEKSGFLDRLQPGAVIMAVRDFKDVENLLLQKQCTLLRLPSVDGSQNLDDTELPGKRQLASLKIHMERVVRWLREFKFLLLHSCVSAKLIPYMDFITVIACGLINLQGLMVKC